jgi:hypothetical protein
MTYADMIDAELGQIRRVDLLEFDHLTRARLGALGGGSVPHSAACDPAHASGQLFSCDRSGTCASG